MMINKKQAFTILELIVVITILAILGTIAFLSYQGYSKDSRNVVRVTEIGLIETAFSINHSKNSTFPMPDSPLSISYSGGLLWNQGYIGTGVLSNVSTLSKLPLDPLFNVQYTYSLLKTGNRYEIGSIQEGKSLAGIGIDQSFALSNEDAQARVVGNYDSLDISSSTGSNCVNIAAPSIMINNPPANGVLTGGLDYNFVFNKSYSLPENYLDNMDITVPGLVFSIDEVYNKCTVDTLSDINNYIISLSYAYQEYNAVPAYDEVSNYPRTIEFIKKSIFYLNHNGIKVSKNLVAILENAMLDSFTGIDNDILVVDHTSDTFSTWKFVSPSTNSGSYIISNNMLEKTDALGDLITPILNKAKTSADTTVSLEIVDFNGGNVVLYGRYQDSDNYYTVNLSPGGYIFRKKFGGIFTGFSNVSTTITNGSVIQFVAEGNSIKLIINGNELENQIDFDITGIGSDVIGIPSIGTTIDNYSLYFQ